MRKRGLLTWLGSALIVGGAAVLVCYWWMVHEAATARALRLARSVVAT